MSPIWLKLAGDADPEGVPAPGGWTPERGDIFRVNCPPGHAQPTRDTLSCPTELCAFYQVHNQWLIVMDLGHFHDPWDALAYLPGWGGRIIVQAEDGRLDDSCRFRLNLLDFGSTAGLRLHPHTVKRFRDRAEWAHQRKARQVSFGEALVALQAGRRASRASWPMGAWLTLVTPPAEAATLTPAYSALLDGRPFMTQPYIAMSSNSSGLAPWVPATQDVLARDWETRDAYDGIA